VEQEALDLPRKVEVVAEAVVLLGVEELDLVPLVQEDMAALASVQITITVSAALAEATQEEAQALGQTAGAPDTLVMVGMEELSAAAAELEEWLRPEALAVLERAEEEATQVEQVVEQIPQIPLCSSAEPAAQEEGHQRVEEEVRDLEGPSIFKQAAL
jgi:hypothetical protein